MYIYIYILNINLLTHLHYFEARGMTFPPNRNFALRGALFVTLSCGVSALAATIFRSQVAGDSPLSISYGLW